MKNIRQKIFEKCFFYEKRHCLTQIKVFFFLLLFGNISLMAQNFVVKGKVLDANNEPLIGAAVVLKSKSTVGTVADFDGNFTLEVPDKNAVLTVSYLGMTPQDVKVNGRNMVVVILREDSEMLEEVVVVGYGQQKKASVVGSISQTSGKVLERAGGVSSVGAALTGNLPGVVTKQSSGMPGDEDPEIILRGQTSWNNSAPLILVDGVERPLSSVDMSSVENISVLKDASATAVFGVKGANGVILVTTKRGQEGKAVIDIDFNATAKVPSRLPNKYDSYDALRIRNMAIVNELGLSPESWNYYTPYGELDKYRNPSSLEEYERYPNVDWVDALFKDYSMSYNANVNISGGTSFVKYFTSIDFLNEGDLFREYDNNRGYNSGFGYNRINARSNLDFSLTKSTLLKVNLAGSHGVRKMPWDFADSSYGYWQSAYSTPPDAMMPIYSDGTWGYYPRDEVGAANSVQSLALGGLEQRTTTRINTDFTLEQDLSMLTKGLSARAMFSLDNVFVERKRGVSDMYNNSQNKWIDPETGNASYKQVIDSNTQFEFQESVKWASQAGEMNNDATERRLYYQIQLNYARKFGDHDVSAMGLFSRERNATGSMIPNYREDWAFRATYNYKQRYFIEANGAYNGSEKFSSENRFAFFPSGAIGWMISEENFMTFLRENKILDMLKLRASYGKIGDDNIGERWLYMQQWAYGNTAKLGNYASDRSPYTWYRQSSVGNPDIHWETAQKANYGADFSFFGGIVSGSVDIFNNYRTDILVNGSNRAIPSFFGLTPPWANLGRVRSKGYEISLKFNYLFGNGLRLWADGNVTHAKEKILEQDDAPLLPDYQKGEGKQIGQAYSYIDHGYINSWDDIYASTQMNTNDLQKLPGDYQIVDFNGDGVVDNDDSVPYGFSGNPQNTYNATVGFEWKGFSAFLQFYGVNNVTRQVVFTSLSGKLDNVYNEGTYWSKYDMDADSPLPRWNSKKADSAPGTRYMYDGSYVRLKNAEIAYTFTQPWVKKLGIESLRLYLNGNNLWLWTKMPDDRESNTAGTGWASQGAYPTVKRYNLGLKISL